LSKPINKTHLRNAFCEQGLGVKQIK
jgi:hypothetical protein